MIQQRERQKLSGRCHIVWRAQGSRAEAPLDANGFEKEESGLVVRDGLKIQRPEAGNPAKRFSRQPGHAKGMRARPRRLAVGMREGADAKKFQRQN